MSVFKKNFSKIIFHYRERGVAGIGVVGWLEIGCRRMTRLPTVLPEISITFLLT